VSEALRRERGHVLDYRSLTRGFLLSHTRSPKRLR
jgi:hypothetical protein